MVRYKIITKEDGFEIPIGNFVNREDAQIALIKYVKNGFIREVKE